MPEPVNRYILIHGAAEMGPHPRIEKLPGGTEVILAADYDALVAENARLAAIQQIDVANNNEYRRQLAAAQETIKQVEQRVNMLEQSQCRDPLLNPDGTIACGDVLELKRQLTDAQAQWTKTNAEYERVSKALRLEI